MFALGHVGIGTKLVPRSLRARLPWGWLATGCLLPDLIDKPIFFGLVWLVHLTPAHQPVLRGSRLFGHTLLFFASIAAAALFARSRRLVALAAGILTHLALDLAAETVAGAQPESSIWRALLWPLLGVGFPKARTTGLAQHLRQDAENLIYLVGEVLGGLLLLRDFLLRRRVPAPPPGEQLQRS